jgi:hypothetical protein
MVTPFTTSLAPGAAPAFAAFASALGLAAFSPLSLGTGRDGEGAGDERHGEVPELTLHDDFLLSE